MGAHKWLTMLGACLMLACGGLRVHAQPANASPPTGPGMRIKQLRQEVVVDPDGRMITTTTTQLQILNSAAASQFAQVPVQFDASADDADILEAYTLKADGRKLAVDPTSIVTQKMPQTNQLIPLYSDIEQKIIVFPNVEAGDSLVFTSKLSEKKAFLRGQFTLIHYLNRAVEADDSSYSVTIPKAMRVNVASREMTQDVLAQGDLTTYRWTFSNLTAKVQPVPLVVDPDAGPHYLISSFKDYDVFAHSYAAIVRPKISVTPEIQKRADAITEGISDRKRQARAIYDWVNQHIRYVAIEFGVGGVIPHDPNWTLNNAFGDCKDQAVLFASLLKAKGIPADPVLLNATSRYRLSGVPTFSEFNHMIVWLPESGIYADTTAPGMPFQMLPVADYGRPALHLAETGKSQNRIPVLPPEKAISTYKVHAVMNSRGLFDVDVVTSATGPWAANLRLISDMVQAAGSATAATSVLKSRGFPEAKGAFDPISGGTVTGTLAITGAFHTARPLTGNVLALANGLLVFNRAGDGPMGPLGNTAMADTDETPCYSAHQTEDITFEFADGAHLAETPLDVHIGGEHISYDTKWTTVGNTVIVHREFVSKVSEPTCTGKVREEAAQALAKIRNDYQQTARLASR